MAFRDRDRASTRRWAFVGLALTVTVAAVAGWTYHTANVHRLHQRQTRDRQITSCGGNAVTFQSSNRRVGLLTCEGTAGGPRLLSVSMRVGERASIVGLPNSSYLTVSPAGYVSLDHTRLLAARAGTAVLTVHNYPCWSAEGTPQSTTCGLVTVTINGS